MPGTLWRNTCCPESSFTNLVVAWWAFCSFLGCGDHEATCSASEKIPILWGNESRIFVAQT